MSEPVPGAGSFYMVILNERPKCRISLTNAGVCDKIILLS